MACPMARAMARHLEPTIHGVRRAQNKLELVQISTSVGRSRDVGRQFFVHFTAERE